MMRIVLSPMRRDDTMQIAVADDAIKINGVDFDFSQLQPGSTLPREAIDCPWFAGDITRIDGVLQVSLVLPNGPDASHAARFPQPINVAKNGPVELPQ